MFFFWIRDSSVIVVHTNRMIRMRSTMARLTCQLNRYRLTTAQIVYHLRDHPSLLPSYTWQDHDLTPDYAVLRRFLDFCRRSLEAKLHSETFASTQLIWPG